MKELIELIPTYIFSVILCILWRFRKYKAWETGCDTIAWCEIPKYTEE